MNYSADVVPEDMRPQNASILTILFALLIFTRARSHALDCLKNSCEKLNSSVELFVWKPLLKLVDLSHCKLVQ